MEYLLHKELQEAQILQKNLVQKLKKTKSLLIKIWKHQLKGYSLAGDCTGGLYQVSKTVYEGTKSGLAVLNKKEEL